MNRHAPGEQALLREVARRMGERLDYIRLAPGRVLDAGCGQGDDLDRLQERYPTAHVLGVDRDARRFAAEHWRQRARLSERGSMASAIHWARSLARSGAQALIGSEAKQTDATQSGRGAVGNALSAMRRGQLPLRCHADFNRLPIAADTIDLLWSNLALHFSEDVPATLTEWHRVLARGGLVMFTTFGPDTLRELRSACARNLLPLSLRPLIDMHDIGDMLVAAGFSDPVIDMEMLTLTYGDIAAMKADWRGSAQAHALIEQQRGDARGAAQAPIERQQDARARSAVPAFHAALAAALEGTRIDGRLPLSVELVQGHAWKLKPAKRSDGRAVVEFKSRVVR